MKKQDKLSILLDSSSIDKLPTLGRRSRALLKYRSSEFLDFLRSPKRVKNKDLREIVEFQKKYKKDGSLHSIKIVRETSESEHAFGYRKEAIEEIGKIVYNKEELNADESAAIELVFIHAALNWPDSLNLLVTENDVLLRNRLWFESHFPGGILNLMAMEEAAEVVDLFLKYRGKYSISYNYFCNKGYWYWLSFRTKIPFYNNNVGDPILDALAQRFVFLLMSVDEMGFQYYSGVSNDTMDSTIYHFNYLISLMTGVFDSLAIRTFNQYKLVFKGSNIPSRISLRSNVGKNFLKAVREENFDLRKHIHDYVHFIKVIYLLRERVLHREGLQQACFEYRDKDEKWKANFIRIPREIIYYLRHCGDSKENYEPWTKFGVYKNDFLEPYKFAKSSVLLVSKFCNKYLQLLGFSNFIEKIKKNKPKDDFLCTIKFFEEDNLGL
jgi:hypothetical protein